MPPLRAPTRASLYPELLEPIARVEDQGDDGGTHAVEDRGHPRQPSEVDVERAERRDDDEVRQDERPAAGPRAPEPPANVRDPDANLDGEGAGQRLAHRDALAHFLLREPLLLDRKST